VVIVICEGREISHAIALAQEKQYSDLAQIYSHNHKAGINENAG
jgi:hypothetical protein